MSKFIPKLINESEGTFILIDNVFSVEEGIKWAAEHNLNIKFTCGTYACATEILCKIYEAGYILRPVRRHETFPIGGGGIDMFDTVYCYLPKGDMVR